MNEQLSRIKSKLESLTFSKLDSSTVKQYYIVAYQNKQYEVGNSVITLIQAIKEYNSYNEIIDYIKSTTGKLYTIQQLDILIEKCIVPLFSEADAKKTIKIRRELISSQYLDYFSNLFKVLFNKVPLYFFSFSFILLETLFFTQVSSTLYLQNINIYWIAGGVLLFLLSSIFHEIGHASACKFYNCQHGGIGIGIYAIFPVFYTDVTNVWRLNRSQRVMVDLGGVYFQMIFLIPFFFLFYITENEAIKYFIYITNFNIIFTLNPFFKFDGYWITSDLLGITNLREKTNEIWSHLFRMKNSNRKALFIYQLKPHIRNFIFIYFIVINIFFAYCFLYRLPLFFFHFMKEFPVLLYKQLKNLSLGILPSVSEIFSLLISLFILSLIVLFLFRNLKLLIKKIV